MSKVQLNHEIMQAMKFLGIKNERYLEMKKAYGNAIKLHEALGQMLGA